MLHVSWLAQYSIACPAALRRILEGHAETNVKQGITILPFRSSRFERPSTRIFSTLPCAFLTRSNLAVLWAGL
ncbi:hypothetical protein Agau_C100105 [Agrobacterium tumefaciens F2]|nr:hypothetical protein Agau_C100105 [Agrobacterium tumefaciens F2]